jgi:GNAT superfamily N-acetyltransferase
LPSITGSIHRACASEYRVTRLTAPPGRGFAGLTYVPLAARLAEICQTSSMVALAATIAGEPAALGLAELGVPDAATASLLSIATAEPHRRRGVARRVLEAIEAAAREAACTRVRAVIPDDLPAVARLFEAAGWEPPVPERLIARAWVDQLASAPWTGLWYPDGYENFQWQSLTEGDRRELAALRARSAFPEYLDPLGRPDRLDAQASTGLRLHGRLVGWFICDAAHAEDTRWVSSLFATLETAKHGRAAPLLGRSLRQLRGTVVKKLVWEVQAWNDAMVRFTMKRLAPWSYSVRRASAVVKRL